MVRRQRIGPELPAEGVLRHQRQPDGRGGLDDVRHAGGAAAIGDARPGGYSASSRTEAEEALVPENVIRRLPEGVAVYFEPGQVAWTIRTAPVRTTQAHKFEDRQFHGGAPA